MNKSFTLIEILVVIVVIGVLSAFILVGMSSVTNSANIAKGQAFANSVKNALLINLVSEWKLDGNGNDSWGINNGSWSGSGQGYTTASWRTSSECVSGGCLAFDGLDDILTCGNNSSLWMGTRDHTVSLWVRFDTTTPTQDETLVMCGAGDSGLGHAGYWIYRRQATSILRLCFTDGSANQICNDLSANATPANNWYSVVIMFDRDATAYAYINGVKQTGYGVDIHLQNLFVQNVGVLRIGAWDGTFDRMAGKIDDVKMYHALVSSFQINENYFVGINKLFKNNGLALNEYNQKLVELKTNLALNKNTPN